ncbi:MAG: PD40 domain-containing protein [Saprospiraceae bacterium]|nr:PD40 domain-containing protein [Saprospiraceae bacterium]
MKSYCLAAILLLSFSLLQAQDNAVYFAEYPALSPDGQTIYFSYDSDIWRVPASGGLATRLTAMDGHETRPRVSPDGKWLAFSANQFGSSDVYIMPVAGGDIQRLSWHEASDDVECWSWDSQRIYFTSSRYNRISTYSVAVGGGTPERLFEHYFNNVHNPAIHPQTGEFFSTTVGKAPILRTARATKAPSIPTSNPGIPKPGSSRC